MVRIFILLFSISLALPARAQFATVSLSRKDVIVEQPVKVKVTA